MLTERATVPVANYDLLWFLVNHGYDDIQFKLICFWGRHPKAKLSLYTISHALDTSSIVLKDALDLLVDQGILTRLEDSNGLTTYSSAESQSYWPIEAIAKLDLGEIIELRKQLKQKIG